MMMTMTKDHNYDDDDDDDDDDDILCRCLVCSDCNQDIWFQPRKVASVFGARAMHREELEMAALNGFSFCAYIVPTNSIEYKRMMHLLSLIELRTTMYPVGFLRVTKWGCEENSNQNYMVF